LSKSLPNSQIIEHIYLLLWNIKIFLFSKICSVQKLSLT